MAGKTQKKITVKQKDTQRAWISAKGKKHNLPGVNTFSFSTVTTAQASANHTQRPHHVEKTTVPRSNSAFSPCVFVSENYPTQRWVT